MGRSRSRSRSRSRRSRSHSRSRDRYSSRYDRDRSRSRDRSSRKHRKSRRHRRRSYSRSSSPPSRRYDDSPPTSSSAIFSSPHSKNEALSSFILGADFSGDSSTMGASLPEEVKKDLCVKDWDPNKMSGAAIRWVAEQVAEQISARTKEIDSVVRDRVAKAKIELEVRLRAQIEQELKEEMEAAIKREQDSLNRVKLMEQSLAEKIKEVENDREKLSEERLKMLETKSKLEMEKNSLQAELDKMKKNEQQSILNTGGFQRKPIKLSFGK